MEIQENAQILYQPKSNGNYIIWVFLLWPTIGGSQTSLWQHYPSCNLLHKYNSGPWMSDD